MSLSLSAEASDSPTIDTQSLSEPFANEVRPTTRLGSSDELAAATEELQLWRQSLAQQKTEVDRLLQEQRANYESLGKTLQQLSSSTSTPALYPELNALWRTMVDLSLADWGQFTQTWSWQTLPPRPSRALATASDSPEAKAYREAYAAAQIEQQQADSACNELKESNTELAKNLLITSSRLRSELLQQTQWPAGASPFTLSEDYLSDIWREVRIVPYRWIALITIDWAGIQTQLHGGIRGLLALIERFLALFSLLTLPWLSWLASYRGLALLDLWRQRRFREGALSSLQVASFGLLQRVEPYVPWLVHLGVLLGLRLYFHAERFPIADFLISLGLLYAAYRLLRLLIARLITHLGETISDSEQSIWDRAPITKVERTASAATILVFLLLFLLKATEATVGQALVYRMVEEWLSLLALLSLMILAQFWRQEIAKAAQLWLPEPFGTKLQRYCMGPLSILACAPIALVLFGKYLMRILLRRLEQRDVYKRLTAALLQRQLSAQQKLRPTNVEGLGLPADYVQHMRDSTASHIISQANQKICVQLREVISTWRLSSQRQDLPRLRFLVGAEGSGRSTLLAQMACEQPELELIRASIPTRSTHPNDARNFIEELCSTHSLGDKAIQAKLILLDHGENLLLANADALLAWRAFVAFALESPSDYFFCIAMPRQSFAFLAWASPELNLQTLAMHLSVWDENEIKTWILGRHRQTRYRLVYDQLIPLAAASPSYGQSSKAEAQYFRLLWSESDGTPGSALMLWLESLSLGRDGELKVNVPSRWEPSTPLGWNSSQLFFYAALLRYRRLHLSELVSISRLSAIAVSLFSQEGLESGLLLRDQDQRIGVHPAAQGWLLEHLRSQNIIHA